MSEEETKISAPDSMMAMTQEDLVAMESGIQN
jgi:hypothetical protein